jgi:uncharacterized membrane protein (UPF0136 family)
MVIVIPLYPLPIPVSFHPSPSRKMSVSELAIIEGFIYGILLIAGGIIGYTKAQSKPSLYAGSVSGIFAIIFSSLGMVGHDLIALFLLASEAILLSAFFYIRYSSTKKFMPSGLMVLVSAISLILYLVGILTA